MSVRPVAAARRAAAPWMVLTLALCAVLRPARAEDESPPRRPAVRAAAHAAVRPKDLPSRCVRCHGADGTGRDSRPSLREIPDFSNHEWQASRTDTELLVSILDGRGAHMPSYRGKVAEDEARALVASVRRFDATPDAPAPGWPATEFERRFRELEMELEDLKKQFRELSVPPRKP